MAYLKIGQIGGYAPLVMTFLPWNCYILAYYGELFSLEAMKEMLKEHELQFEFDVNVYRYVNGKEELLNGSSKRTSKITVKKFEMLMKDKHAIFQFKEPQRYSVCVIYSFSIHTLHSLNI